MQSQVAHFSTFNVAEERGAAVLNRTTTTTGGAMSRRRGGKSLRRHCPASLAKIPTPNWHWCLCDKASGCRRQLAYNKAAVATVQAMGVVRAVSQKSPKAH